MKALDRRTWLKGMLGGAAISVALPPLEAMMNDHGTAWAGGAGFPKRFGTFFWGNGIYDGLWTPPSTGTGFTLSRILMPLAPLREHLTVVSGTNIPVGVTDPHESYPPVVFSGTALQETLFGGTTIDQLIAREPGNTARIRSIQTSSDTLGNWSSSYRGAGQYLPPEFNPRLLFLRLFSDGQVPGAPIDPTVLLRRSVLDAVTEQSGRLRTRLGADDRRRLDQHLDSVRSVERELQRIEQGTRYEGACQRPAEPPDVPFSSSLDVRARARLLLRLQVIAMACDLTRVFSHIYTRPTSNSLRTPRGEGHHTLTHEGARAQAQVLSMLDTIMEDLRDFLTALRDVREGDGTLLDHTLVYCTTDCSDAFSHSGVDYPILLAGGRSVGLRQNLHLRASGGTTKVGFSILQMMGVRVTEFGVGVFRTTEGISGLVA
jgi:hypothetical protein